MKRLFSYLKNLDSKYSIGLLLGILGLGYAVYTEHFKSTSPEIVFDIIANTQVLSIKENINKLNIVYDKQDLKSRNENLVILTVRVSNNGASEIKEVDYFSKIPFGMKVIGGKIAEQPILLNTSSAFLSNELRLRYDTLGNLFINKLPIDKRDFFTIKILSICKGNNLPSILPLGKISGVSTPMPVLSSYMSDSKSSNSFSYELFYGTFLIHILRFFIYVFSIAIVVIVIVIPINKIGNLFEQRKINSLIKKFNASNPLQSSDKFAVVYSIVKNEGFEFLLKINRILGNDILTNKYSVSALEYDKNKVNSRYTSTHTFALSDAEMHEARLPHLLSIEHDLHGTVKYMRYLIDSKAIVKDGANYVVDKEFKKNIAEFINFIRINK